MKAVIFIEYGTEITEFFAPIDILHRAGIETFVIAGNHYANNLNLITKVVDSSKTDYEIPNDADVIILPGGKLGVNKLLEFAEYYKNKLINHFNEGKLVAAICAAPSVLGELGLLKRKKYTCYPGWESDSFNGTYTGKEVEISGNIITARSMYYSTDFGLAIVEYLLGKNKRIEIENQVKGIQ